MNNLGKFGVQELKSKEIKETQGGGPIADFINYWKCSCRYQISQPDYVFSMA